VPPQPHIREAPGRAVRAPRRETAALLVTGAASTAVRRVLDGPRRDARVLAAFRLACYLELSGPAEPRVLALVTARAVRLPNALVVPDGTPLDGLRPGTYGQVGAGVVAAGPVLAGAARWWDPVPVLSPVTPEALDHRLDHLDAVRAASERQPGLTPSDGPGPLTAACATDALADAVEQAERIVGLGPGLTPSGDDFLCGLLLALRLLTPCVARTPPAVPAGGAAVRLADWIGAAVTSDATTRTTALSATLLHCAAAGQASGEAAGVLRALTCPGGQDLTVATRRLLATGHTSGADLAWGLAAGARAVTALARIERSAA
jgi:hypothetical protein